MKIIKKVVVSGIVLILFLLGSKEYMGYDYFYKYKDIREHAKSIEKNFSELEGNLKKALWFSKNPLFYKETARLYLEMALVVNESGIEEKRDLYVDMARDFYLDMAKGSLIQVIKRNPADAFSYYEMGKVYMLYNFPLLTYMDKAKLYFIKALELKPADEFLNLNIIYIYLTQWDFLNDGEKRFVFKRLWKIWKNNQNFIPQIKNRWTENFGEAEKLKEILSTNEVLWLQINHYFKNSNAEHG
ncbi:MAG: hypothetical protein AB1410_05380 [Acidobacteriota bacterium]